MASTEILCLANSKKLGGRCLAGLSWPDLQTWIRPVERAREHGEVPSDRAQVNSPEGRRRIRPLDVINVDLIEPDPTPAQPENWILGSNPITLVRTPDIAEVANRLRSAADTSSSVFDLGDSRSVPESVASLGLPKSIDLHEVQALSFQKDDWDKWRTEFQYGNRPYRYFPVSDLDVLERLERADHRRVICDGRWFLTISLGEPWRGFHWLTVAAAIRGGSEIPHPALEEEPF
jgi:hypothetical protein